ncbi:hypothetical protein GCM10017559_37780 [Streptosporangium longisporum]|uniref:Uncharacterized protein n=1 Tax=Streptosporangium longisporum TaxID=46187 RepID=A0ABP6KNC3_9ACTN
MLGEICTAMMGRFYGSPLPWVSRLPTPAPPGTRPDATRLRPCRGGSGPARIRREVRPGSGRSRRGRVAGAMGPGRGRGGAAQ